MVPETSDSISLKSFIASIIQTVSPTLMTLPTSTNNGFSGDGFLYKVPIIGEQFPEADSYACNLCV